MESKTVHLMYVPFTGLGLYNGFRGNRWLRNRLKVFKQFVIPSLEAQSNQNFVVWFSWRPEEKRNPIVIEFMDWMNGMTKLKSVHTFHGCCFYDDKYDLVKARDRLLNSLHGSMGELTDITGEADYVLMTIQPSDDLYHKDTVKFLQLAFKDQPQLQAVGFKRGYICNYLTKEINEYNPTTNPPFYTIKFPREVFIDPLKHAEYTALKTDAGKYPKGTPLPSHEYVGLCLNYGTLEERGFLVGTHTENISTHFNHPFKGEKSNDEILADFGILNAPVLKLKFSMRKRILRKLPYKVQRKLRYWFGEILWQKLYEYLRN